MTETQKRLRAWLDRKHERVCDRAPGTYGADDAGAAAGCNCADYADTPITELLGRAAEGHRRFEHPGPVDDCQSPHDVLCKAVWP